MAAEEAATEGSGVNITISKYESYFRTQERVVENFIRGPYTEDFAITTHTAETTDDTLTLEGKSPSRIYTLRVVDHPEAVLTWDGLTDWKLTGISLKSGSNVIKVEGLTHQGEVLEEKEFTVTKPTNAAPVVAVKSNPGSLNVGISDTLVLDAGSSFDPEGGGLAFAWVAPQNLLEFTPEASGSASAKFSVPGLYQFTVTATDPDGNSASKTVEAAVYGRDGFASFNDPLLARYWGFDDIELRDNFSPDSYYTLDFRPGRLTMQVLDDSAKPLGLPQAPLPAPETYMTLGQTWKFDDSGADLGTDFATAAFDDSAWKSGAGLLGFESRTLPDPGLQTTEPDFTRGNITYYLRTAFEFDKEPLGSEITIDHILDDGARFFLNGKELGRTRLPAGTIDATTVADKVSTEGEVEEAAIIADGSSALVRGTNILAVDLHNESASSSDLVFGINMHIAARELSGGNNTSLDGTIHPWIHRPLPSAGDWILQTKVELETLQFGDFQAGLLVEISENGLPVRYGIGLENGDKVGVFRVNTSGTTGSLASIPYIVSNVAEIRIRREGGKLIFDWNQDDEWSELYQADLAAGTTIGEGGTFVATGYPRSVQASFDYVMLVDPSAGDRSPLAQVLQVSELMYNPIGGETYEFMELQNVGAQPLDLTGIRFLDGEPFGELTLGQTTLAPGAYGLLVSNAAAFRERYGNGLDSNILGEWSGGNLKNSGETITLVDAAGATIHSFEYGDSAPWPAEADGDGPSLVLINPQSAPDHANAGNWRASSSTNGSPGAEDSGPDPGFLAFALGADILGVHPGSLISVATSSAAGTDFLAFTYVRRTDALGVRFAVETSTDLQNWNSDGSLTDLATSDNGNGTTTISVGSPLTVGNGLVKYMRLRVSQE